MNRIQGSPSSIIFGVLILSFLLLLIFSFFSTSKNDYVIEKNKSLFIWGKAFLYFLNYFIGLQAAGALLAYSLFIEMKKVFDKKSFTKLIRSIFIPLILLLVLYFILSEALGPFVKKKLAGEKILGQFSENLFSSAKIKKKEGKLIEALEDLRFSLLVDPNNSAKIEERSLILNLLSKNQNDLNDYLLVHSSSEFNIKPDIGLILQKGKEALKNKDYTKAWFYSQQVLKLDLSNQEALFLATISWEQASQQIERNIDEIKRNIYGKKKLGYQYLTSGKAEDLIKAYFVFLELWREYPIESEVAQHLRQAKELLPTVSFFITDAEKALSYPELLKKDIAFFNYYTEDKRELVSLEAMVAFEGEIYFRNIKVLSFDQFGEINFQFSAPLGKLLFVKENNKDSFYINLTGIDRQNSAKRSQPLAYIGEIPKNSYGYKLNFKTDNPDSIPLNPQRLDYFALNSEELQRLDLNELIMLLPILNKNARSSELIFLELLERICRLLLILFITFACFNIGMTQKARYFASTPKTLYLFVIIIPFAMAFLSEFILFQQRMFIHFIFYLTSSFWGIFINIAIHLFLVIFSMALFLKRLTSFKN